MCWCDPQKRTPWCENCKNWLGLPRPALLEKLPVIDLRPIRADQVTFVCPGTGKEAFSLLLERSDRWTSALVECSDCGRVHVIDLTRFKEAENGDN